MELWHILISIFAGIVTISIFLEKIGLSAIAEDVVKNRRHHNAAILVLLRGQLEASYQQFRPYEAWTLSACEKNTELHKAYIGLGGNGRETIRWKKQSEWSVVTEDEMDDLIADAAVCRLGFLKVEELEAAIKKQSDE